MEAHLDFQGSQVEWLFQLFQLLFKLKGESSGQGALAVCAECAWHHLLSTLHRLPLLILTTALPNECFSFPPFDSEEADTEQG